jgi:hypothetical protein
MPVESCTQSVCDLALQFGDDESDGGGMVRNCHKDTVVHTHPARDEALALGILTYTAATEPNGRALVLGT